MPRAKRGEIQFSSDDTNAQSGYSADKLLVDEDQRKGEFQYGVILLAILAVFFGYEYFKYWAPSPAVSGVERSSVWSICTAKTGVKPCLPPAPASPARFAVFKVASENQPFLTHGFIISASNVVVHVVAQLPRLDGVIVRPGIQRAVALHPKHGPFVINGDVDIQVGELRDGDVMQSALRMEGNEFRQLEILYEPSVRGPPQPGHQPIIVYIVGRVGQYDAPNQADDSVHHAAIIDLPLAGKRAEWDEYEQELSLWRAKLSAITGLHEVYFRNATGDSSATLAASKSEIHPSPETSVKHGFPTEPAGTVHLQPYGGDSVGGEHAPESEMPHEAHGR
jgi:hypothetical protein